MGGGVTPIGAVSRVATGVKMQSNSQAVYWGTIYGTTGDREAWPILVRMCDGQGSRAKLRCGQAVKAVFRWSKILSLVTSLDMVPMEVTPLPPPCICRYIFYDFGLKHALHIVGRRYRINKC